MNNHIDLNFRPSTYRSDFLDTEHRLASIQGIARRSRELRHPSLMGGDYLPAMEETCIEIARISLMSTTSDQISIRANVADENIGYSVCDEYETEFVLAFTDSRLPLTLAELIRLIDDSRHPEDEQPGGLLVCHWENMLSWGESLDAAINFASIESAWYPQLSEYYAEFANAWCERKRSEEGYELEEEDYA